jgi:hypothetical protein
MSNVLACVAAAALALAASAGASGAAQPAPTCPSADRHRLVSSRPGAGRELVPPGAGSVLLCRYSGMFNGIGPRLPAYRLQGRDLVDDAATVAGIAREIDSLPRSTAPIACPADFGRAIVASFRYASGPQDPVTIALDGCFGAGNGRVSRVGLSESWYRFVNGLAARTGLHLPG